MNNQSHRDRIAEEAVGQTHESPPTYAAKEDIAPEEALRRIARSAGAQASTSEKTAESVGERVGDAYSDAGSVAQWKKRSLGLQAGTGAASRADGMANLVRTPGRQFTRFASKQFNEQPFMMTVACFALGYVTAVLFHGRINAYFGKSHEQFQIMKPPQGDEHPRGFVQSTVLKTITEHALGMTTAEIVAELASHNISQEAIANAVGALVQAKKIRLQERERKYFPAAAEVPTAPDQPSS
jgi:hypothetical protein